MAKTFIVVLVIGLAAPHCALGSILAGTVVDPQQRIIVGAQVKLRCGRQTEQGATHAAGEFAFTARPSFENCSLVASHPGFATLEQTLGPNPMQVTIELQLAKEKQGVSVQENTPDLRQILQSSVGSTSLSDADLKDISNNTQDLIRYAKSVAGANTSHDAVYVDGLPSAALPPAEMVGRIDVHGDPFSAEYSDDDQTHINITTKSAGKHWHFNFGGAGLGVGGNNPLAPNLPSVSHSGNINLAGPVPHLPFTFSLHAGFGSAANDLPIEAVQPTGLNAWAPGGKATVTNHNGSGLLNLHYSRGEASQAYFSYSQSGSKGSNVGAGGLTLPEAASRSHSQFREARLTYTKAGIAYLYRGGLDFTERVSGLEANSGAAGLTVPGSFVAGGASISSNYSTQVNWIAKSVIQSDAKGRIWTAGLTLSRSAMFNVERPNRHGLFEFSTVDDFARALAGLATGTWFVTDGNGKTRYTSVEAAPFVQGELFRSRSVLIAGGVRTDYQTGGGALVSPRLSAAATSHAFVFRAGAGIFVHNWPSSAMLRAVEDDGRHLAPYIFQNVSLTTASNPPTGGQIPNGPLVVTRLSPDLTRPRDWMWKSSVERTFRRLTPGLEYTWIDGQHLLGSQRLVAQDGWLDVLESNRDRRRQSVHARFRYALRRQSLTANYEWVHSRDNTDGPFSFPAIPGDLGAEWARSSATAPHNVSLVDTLRLPRAISVTLMASGRSSAPYNITSGLDNGDGLFNDRGGRPRNSGNGPNDRSLDLFGSRRIPVPGTARAGRRMYLIVGVEAQNLLNHRNYLFVDSTASSALFGKPLTAGLGRSVRFWVNLE